MRCFADSSCWFFFSEYIILNEEQPVYPGLHVVNWQCEYALQIFFYLVSTGILTKFSSHINLESNTCVLSNLWFWCNWDRIVLSPVLLLLTHTVVSDSLRRHGLQHARLPCPTLSPGVCSNSCPLSWWCHPTISSSVAPFFSCLQSFPASESLSVSRLFTLGGQTVGASASASVLPMNISFMTDWFDVLAVQGTIKGLLQHHSSKASILWHSFSLLYGPTLTFIYDYWKNHSFDCMDTGWQSDVSAF